MNDKDIALKLKIEDKQSAEKLAEGLFKIRCTLEHVQTLAEYFSSESITADNIRYTTGVFNSAFGLMELAAKEMREHLIEYGGTICEDSDISKMYA